MALRKQTNYLDVVIMDTANVTALAAGTIVTPSTLENGRVVVTDMSLRILSNTTVLTAKDGRIRLVQGRGSTEPLKISSPIQLNDIVDYRGAAFSAAQQKIEYIGYNGVTSTTALNAIDDNQYTIHMNPKSNSAADRSQAKDRFGVYLSDSSATQEEVALNLIHNLIANWKDEPEVKANGMIRFNLVNSAALVTTDDFDNTCVTVRGSDRITHTTNAQYGGGTALAVGDYIRFNAADAGTVLATDPVYRVEELVSATETRLDRAVSLAGVSYTGNDSAGMTVIPAATATAANFGIKMEGLALQFDVTNFRLYHVFDWATSLEGFGTTDQTTAQVALPGVGVPEKVALDEYESWINEGQYTLGTPPSTIIQETNLSGSYSPLSLRWKRSAHGTFGAGEQSGELLLYVENTNAAGGTLSTGATDATLGVVTVLDDFAGQLAGISAQVGNLT